MSTIFLIQSLIYIFVLIVTFAIKFWIIPDFVNESDQEMAEEYTDYAFIAVTALLASEVIHSFFNNNFDRLTIIQLVVSIFIVGLYLFSQLFLIPRFAEESKKEIARDFTDELFFAIFALFASEAFFHFIFERDDHSHTGGRRRR